MIGVPDEQWGETVKALVVPAPGADVVGGGADRATAASASRTSSARRRSSSARVLARTATGKLQKFKLRAPYWVGPRPPGRLTRRDGRVGSGPCSTAPSDAPASRSAQYCLGAMMFGAWGNTDHDDCVRIIHRALDAGINFIDTADVYSAGESEEIVGQGARRPPRRRRARDEVPRADGRRIRTSSGNSRRWIIQEVENSLRRLGTDYIDLYQIHRPDPSGRHRRDARGAERPRPRREDPLPRALDVPGASTSSRRSGPPSAAAASGSCASSRRTRCSSAGSSATCCPTCERYGIGVIPGARSPAGWLTGRYRKGQPTARAAPARAASARAATRAGPANRAQARRRRGARRGRRGGRADADPPGASPSSSSTRR